MNFNKFLVGRNVLGNKNVFFLIDGAKIVSEGAIIWDIKRTLRLVKPIVWNIGKNMYVYIKQSSCILYRKTVKAVKSTIITWK